MDRYPTAADFQAARVTNPGQAEIIRQSLYDFQILPGAGAQQLSFFQSPIGQGVTSAIGATATTAKTAWDTNMNLGGQLPSGLSMLVESIEIRFLAGSVSTANTFTLENLTKFAAVAAASVVGAVSDVNAFYSSGMLEFNILQKNYLREVPLGRFPSKTVIETSGALASNSATTGITSTSTANATGRPYYLEPPISLQPATNFELLLKWPAASALPSGFNARVGVILDGFQMRASQ